MLILIGVRWLILVVLVVPIVAVNVDLDVAMWVFAFGFVLSCFLGCGECHGCVVVVAVSVGWWQLVVVVVVGC